MADTELDLVRRYQNGDRNAGGALLAMFGGLILNVAKRSLSRSFRLNSVLMYDEGAGVHLACYAKVSMRYGVHRAKCETGTTIRVPCYLYGNKAKTHRYYQIGRCAIDTAYLEDIEPGSDDVDVGTTDESDAPGPDSVIESTEQIVWLRRVLQDFEFHGREADLLNRHILSDEPMPLAIWAKSVGVHRSRAYTIKDNLLSKLKRAVERAPRRLGTER